MARLLYSFCIVLLGIGTANAESFHHADGSSMLLQEIEKKGASAVVRRLWGQSDWEVLTRSIASGQPAWIDVALKLRGASDAGASSELHDALFEALGRNPTYILQVVGMNGAVYSPVQLEDICRGRADPLTTYEEAIAELSRTTDAVEKVKNKKLQEKKNICIEELRSGKDDLAIFFGKKNRD